MSDAFKTLWDGDVSNNGSGSGGGGDDDKFKKEFEKPDEYKNDRENLSKFLYPLRPYKVILFLLSGLSAGIYFATMNNVSFFTKVLKLGEYKQNFILISFAFLALGILSLIFLSNAKCDTWLPHLAENRIGSTFVKVYPRRLVLDFDITNKMNDIKAFVEECTNKSDDFNYFIVRRNNTTRRLIIRTKVRTKIPDKAPFTKDVDANENWNYIPLGLTITDDSEIGTVNWMMNDSIDVQGPHKKSLASVSFLVTGGTGSGKSVLENNILRHVIKYNDKIQAIVADPKCVEFGWADRYAGIAAVATSIEEIKDSLEAARSIMMQRFKFMEAAGVNHVNKVPKDYQVDWYELTSDNPSETNGDHRMCFDEIVMCYVNDEPHIYTIQKAYEEMMAGKEVKIAFDTKKDESKTKTIYTNDAIDETIEKEPEENIYIVDGDEYSGSDKVKVEKPINGRRIVTFDTLYEYISEHGEIEGDPL